MAQGIEGAGLLSIRYAFAVALTFVGGTLLARALLPEVWGVFSAAQFALLIFQDLSVRGMVAYLIRKPTDLTISDVRTAGLLQQGLWGVVAIGMAVLTSYLSRQYQSTQVILVMAAVGVTSYLYSLRSVPLALMERKLAYARVGVVEVADVVGFFVVAIAGVALGFGLQALVAATVARGLVSTSVAYLLERILPVPALDRSAARDILGFGLAFVGSNAATLSLQLVPLVVLGFRTGPAGLAFVQLSISLYGAVLFIAPVVTRVSFSTYSRIADDPRQLAASVAAVVSVSSLFVGCVLVWYVGFSPLWVPALLGNNWLPVTSALFFALPAYLLAGVFWAPVSSALFAAGAGRQIIASQFGLSAIYWVASLLLVPRLGYLGLSLAWAVAHVLVYPVLIAFFASTYRVPTLHKHLARLAIPLAAAGLIWLMLGGGSSYGAGAVAVGFPALWYVVNRDGQPALSAVTQAVFSRWRRGLTTSAQGNPAHRIKGEEW